MTYSCIHTHSTFCDGKDDIETMCRAAYAKNFESIGFSSHAPAAKKLGFATDWHLKEERLGEYIEAVRAARKRWEGKLAVYLGLEADFVAGRCGPACADVRNLPLDYLIGAVHYVCSPEGSLMAVDNFDDEFEREFKALFNNDGKALYRAYYGACREMLRGGGFDVLAHPDLVKKNNRRFKFFSPDEEDYQACIRETVDAIARAAESAPASRPLIVEVNTGGMIRGRTADAYPSRDILRLLRARNIPVTINADAHAASHLGGFYGEGIKDLLEAGYTEILLLDGVEGGKPRWRRESIV
ncbi:MAG: histidinol-phosphatase [Treponema sp.]|nr:histidinol-phosphatase [Treponema sp.]